MSPSRTHVARPTYTTLDTVSGPIPRARTILATMAAPEKKPKKKVVTAAVRHRIERSRRDLAEGKGMTVGELLTKVLERDARGHAA